MKKIFMVLVMVLCLVTGAFGATKYDAAKKTDPSWSRFVDSWNKILKPNQMLLDYFNVVVNEGDVIKFAKSGKLDKERSKFLMENSSDYTKVLHVLIAQQISETAKTREIQDAQYIYVTGVVKDPRAQAATNGPEYEIEKQVFRGFPLYQNWELWKNPETLASVSKYIFDGWDKKIKK